MPTEAGKNIPLRTAGAVPEFCWELLVSALGCMETVLESSARKLFVGWFIMGALRGEFAGKFSEILTTGVDGVEGPLWAILYHLVQAE